MASILHLDAVTRRYGDVTALDRVDLSVAPGEIVALLGPNGAGKSTTFELLLGLVPPTSGTVQVHGREPGTWAARVRTGAMLQTAGLPEQVTVAELVATIGAAYPVRAPVEEVLDRTRLRTRADRPVTALSGGERQRLLLACALVGRPSLLLLDEPTAGMDVGARREFWEQTGRAVSDGATVVFATHDLAEADAVAQRVVVLQDGRIRADTTPAGLKALVSPKVTSLRTDAPVAWVRDLPHVDHAVAEPPPDGTGPARLRLHGDEPHEVIAAILAAGHAIADLSVVDASLEEAFVRLTHQEDADGRTEVASR